MVTRSIATLCMMCVVSLSGRALADSLTETSPTLTASVHHAPIASATVHEDLRISITLVAPHLAKRTLAIVRVAGETELREIEFERATEGYVARIPGELVKTPGLGYAVEIEGVDGKRVAAFASRAALHEVQVATDVSDAREARQLARLHGRRSEALASFDWVDFGLTRSSDGSQARDYYYRVEGSYTYRPLRAVESFTIRSGVVRGSATTLGSNQAFVGLNYVAASVIFLLHDLIHLEVEGLTSVTEVGFSIGGGGALHFGDAYGTKLILGIESVQAFGTRGYARLDLTRNQGEFRVSPIVEVTDMPHSNRTAVRLLTEVAVQLGRGFGVVFRGGWQARDFTGGMIGGGVGLSYQF